jgi:hypothetical protein
LSADDGIVDDWNAITLALILNKKKKRKKEEIE